MKSSLSRRQFLTTLGLSAVTAPVFPMITNSFRVDTAPASRKVHIFSKHLQWLDYNAMATFVAECGFDGADITVRPGGHVEPTRVQEDLPRVVEAMKKSGKEVTMITTAILSADEAEAEPVIRTAAGLGIQLYRLGWYPYDTKQSIAENLKSIEGKLRKLASLSENYKIKGCYQNHSGNSFGSPVWDLARVLHAINSPWVGCQYDVRHAVVEGANSWSLGFDYIKPYINSLDVKDFQWAIQNGKWTAENVPLGNGAVDFNEYFRKIGSIPATVPVSLHMEYPLGGAENGSRTITVSRDEVRAAMMRDLKFIRERVSVG